LGTDRGKKKKKKQMKYLFSLLQFDKIHPILEDDGFCGLLDSNDDDFKLEERLEQQHYAIKLDVRSLGMHRKLTHAIAVTCHIAKIALRNRVFVPWNIFGPLDTRA